MRTRSGNRSAFSSGRPASSRSSRGISSRSSAFAGNGPSKTTAPSGVTGARQVLPAGPFSTASAPSGAVSGALNRRVIGSTGMHPARGLSRSQLNSARNAARVSKASTWSRSVATPDSDRMPLPHTRLTRAFTGSRWTAWTSTCRAGSGSRSSSHGWEARICSRSAPRRMRSPMRSWRPGAATPAWAATEASSGAASRVRMNTWSSLIARCPANGSELTTAGPPVEKRKSRFP